jgi:hypothetical protein
VVARAFARYRALASTDAGSAAPTWPTPGRPAVGDAVFVVTHLVPTTWPYPDAPFTFVTDGRGRIGLRGAFGAAATDNASPAGPGLV